MARKATGAVVVYEGKTDTSFALRFTAYGERQFVTLGKASEGWTQSKAEVELGYVLADVARGTWQPPSAIAVTTGPDDPNFHEFASEWFEQIRHELAPGTAETYKWHLSHFLLPFFKDHRLSEITVQEVDRYRQAMVAQRDRIAQARERGETTRKPASNETINKTITRLGQILDLGVEYGHVAANAARGARRKLKTNKATRSYLDTAGQISALLNAAGELDNEATHHRHVSRHTMLAMLVFAGLRLDELLSLCWRDLDLTGGWITVGRSKTDAGVRKIKIRPALKSALLAYATTQKRPPDGLVFGTADRKARAPHNKQSPSNFRRMLRAVMARADERLAEQNETPLPAKLTPHGLRHTWASVMFAIGEPVPTVMADGGWADAKTPLTIYAHALRREEGDNEALKTLVEGPQLAGSGRNATVTKLERKQRGAA